MALVRIFFNKINLSLWNITQLSTLQFYEKYEIFENTCVEAAVVVV